MKLYVVYFEGCENSKSFEMVLPNGNTMSILYGYKADSYEFWGGETPRPWNVTGDKIRRLIYNIKSESSYTNLLAEINDLFLAVLGEDNPRNSSVWWICILSMMHTMKFIERTDGALWQNSVAELHEKFNQKIINVAEGVLDWNI